MTVIPNFILKRLYVASSLKRDEDDVIFQIFNNLGPGMITKVNQVTMNERVFSPEQIVFEVDGQPMPAEEISEENPASFFLNQTITCRLKSPSLDAGAYQMSIELVSKEAGKVSLVVSDKLN